MNLELYLSDFEETINQIVETAKRVDNDEETIELNRDLRSLAAEQVVFSIKNYWEIYLTKKTLTRIKELSDYIKEIDVDHLETSVLDKLINQCCDLVNRVNNYISSEF